MDVRSNMIDPQIVADRKVIRREVLYAWMTKKKKSARYDGNDIQNIWSYLVRDASDRV